MTLNLEKSYLSLFDWRESLTRHEYLLRLIPIFLADQENTFLFNVIRNELKKSIKLEENRFEVWVLKRFGVSEIWKTPKRKLAFVDHSFHCKTASSMFFVRELEKYYDVDIFWSSRWKGIPDDYLKDLHLYYSRAIYWQALPDPHCFQPAHTVIVPMWDAVCNEDEAFYKRYQEFPVLSFSQALHDVCRKNNLSSRYIRVNPKISGRVLRKSKRRESNNSNEPVIYFWQRTNNFTWRELKRIISNNVIGSVLICDAVDPGASFVTPSASDISQYNIEIVSWSDSKNDILEVLENVDIYVAPRMEEGIGFSFLEAIECGCTIICNNASTMDEYIDDRNGYVIDYRNLMPVDLSDWKVKKENMRNRYAEMPDVGEGFSENIASALEEMIGC